VSVPKRKLDAYRRLARTAGEVWREPSAAGVPGVRRRRREDRRPHVVPRSIELTRGETVVFAWIVFKSRADRDRVNAKAMKGPAPR
jgi:uncharacterized protein YbaA (DUF1428 family)